MKNDALVSDEKIKFSLLDLELYLNTTKTTINKYIKTKGLPCYKENRKLYFYKHEIDTWIESVVLRNKLKPLH